MTDGRRVRFNFLYESHIVELFSVLEVANGDLQIFIKRNLNAEYEGKKDFKINHEKYSVHSSLKSLGTTITKTVESEAGKYSQAAFVLDSKEYLFWPIHARATTDQSSKHLRRIPDFGDEEIRVASGIDKSRTLAYFLFVKKGGAPLDEVDGFNLFERQFSRFTIGLYTTYLPVPSSEVGSMLDTPTNSPTLNGSPLVEMESEAKASLDEANFEQVLVDMCVILWHLHRQRFLSFYPNRRDEVGTGNFGTITPNPMDEGELQVFRLLTAVMQSGTFDARYF